MKAKKEIEIDLSELSEGLLKAIALKQHFGEEVFYKTEVDGSITPFNNEEFESELEPIDGDNEFSNHIVLTDEEAYEKAKDYILESAWAFKPSWLSDFTGIHRAVFEAIQANDRCESNNEAILRLIGDDEEFVDEAIAADGRGHFLNTYDGHEHEERVNGQTFYIYRMN